MSLAEVREQRAQKRRLRKLNRRHEVYQQEHREAEQKEATQRKQTRVQSPVKELILDPELFEYKGQRRYTAAQMIKAIRFSRGIKTRAARRLGCDWATVDKYCKDFPAVQEAYQETREELIDLAESKFRKKIVEDQWPAIRFALATIGKDRGYTERIEQILIPRSEAVREFKNDLDRAYNQGGEDGGEDDGGGQTPLLMLSD